MGEREDLEKRIKQLQERRKRIIAKENAQKRKNLTRAKVLIGAAVLKNYPQGIPKLLKTFTEKDRLWLEAWIQENDIEIDEKKSST